jgi:hypothetical protein
MGANDRVKLSLYSSRVKSISEICSLKKFGCGGVASMWESRTAQRPMAPPPQLHPKQEKQIFLNPFRTVLHI